MSVMQITRFKGADANELIKAAREAKVFWEKAGADFVGFSRIHAGEGTGDWLFAVRFSNWTALGRAQDTVAQDAEFQKLLARVLSFSQIVGRITTVGADL